MVEMGRAVGLPVIDGAGEGSEAGEVVVSQVLSTLFHWSFITVCGFSVRKHSFHWERLISAAPGVSSIIRILGVALISRSSLNKYTDYFCLLRDSAECLFYSIRKPSEFFKCSQ